MSPILSEAELQWGEEKRPLRVAWCSGGDEAGTESREMNVGGQPFKEWSEQQSCGEVAQGMLTSQGFVTVINERAPDSELEQ